jgi:hypothetical protein
MTLISLIYDSAQTRKWFRAVLGKLKNPVEAKECGLFDAVVNTGERRKIH